MIPCRVLILTALLPEARALSSALRLPWPAIDRQPSAIEKDPRDQALAIIGLRAARLAAVAAQYQPQAIILAGLAGALAPTLQVGDIISDDSGRHIHTAGQLVTTPAAKAALFVQTGCRAVDMESRHVRAWAGTLGIPCLAIRAISDTADQALDPRLLHLIDDDGRPRTGRALALLLNHPSTLPHLLRLKRATDIALASLASALTATLAAGWPGPARASAKLPA